jgi:Papain family cysteine protease
MQKELMEKGTMTVAFTVFEDFELYKEGVYQHVKGKDMCVCVCVCVYALVHVCVYKFILGVCACVCMRRCARVFP